MGRNIVSYLLEQLVDLFVVALRHLVEGSLAGAGMTLAWLDIILLIVTHCNYRNFKYIYCGINYLINL
jgi:hypothetical protein